MAIIILSVLLVYFIANTVLTVKLCVVIAEIFAFVPAILSYLIVSKLFKKDSSES